MRTTEGTWLEIARGMGWENEYDIRATVQTSTRMEAMGVLRAADWVTRNWAGHVVARLDNQTTIATFEIGFASVRKQDWHRPDNDLWEQMRKHR